jgi:cell division protein FtsQ
LRHQQHFPQEFEPTSRRRGRRALGLVLVACIALGGGIIAGTGVRKTTGELIDDVAVRAGFGIEEISLAGHRFTSDAQIYTALTSDGARSQVSFDAAAARTRVEALPCIEKARISRVLPRGIRVDMTERKAVALWQDGGSHALVDGTGRSLARVAGDALPELPRIAGSGAPAAAGTLLEAIALHPGIRSRLERAVRVGDRRWTLELAGGITAHLPESGLGPALQRLADLEAARELKTDASLVVDLRHAEVTALRTDPQPAPGRERRAAGRAM